MTSSFLKTSIFKRFLSSLKRKASVFKYIRFQEHFRKAPVSSRISVDGRPNRKNKAAFSNFSISALSCNEVEETHPFKPIGAATIITKTRRI